MTRSKPIPFMAVTKSPLTGKQETTLLLAIIEIAKTWGIPVTCPDIPVNSAQEEKYLATAFIRCCSLLQLVENVVETLNLHGYCISQKRKQPKPQVLANRSTIETRCFNSRDKNARYW